MPRADTRSLRNSFHENVFAKLQHTALVCCVLLECNLVRNCNTLHHTATRCNTLHHTASRCTTLHHTAAHGNARQHTATHCTTLQHTATHGNTLQHTATRCTTWQHTAAHCNILQHSHVTYTHKICRTYITPATLLKHKGGMTHDP